MARKIYTRWKISGILTAETPIHVGGMGGDADTDLALAVNGQGVYYIPGTSLAGALRGWMGQLLTEKDINKLWGFQENNNGHASFIIVEDTKVTLPNSMTIEIREGVGIDRHTGAAADKAKYNRAILPKGITFPLNITLDCLKDQDPGELWKLLLALEKGDIRIGAAKTRGLGKVKLSISSIHEQKFMADTIFDVLLEGGKQHSWDTLKPTDYPSPARLTLNIAWQPKDPVMVKAEGDGIAVDILPLVSQVDSGVRFVIPGSSIKGVLRAHAERIVRTVLEIDITPDHEGKPKFNEQIKLLKMNKPIELVDVIFGAAEKSKNNGSEGKIGTLYIDDCYATIPMTSANWSAVENETKMTKPSSDDSNAYLKTRLGKALGIAEPYQVLQPAMHVAVDRWTGGAAEGMLYSVLEPIGVTWEAIGLQLDLDRLQKYNSTLVKPAIALLLLVLRDFANRKIPIGYGTNRGMGTVEVTEVAMSCSPIDGLAGIETKTAITSDLSSLGDLLNSLTDAWRNWITQHQETA